MALKEVWVEDFLRGQGNKRVLLRFNKDDLVEVNCSCDYGVIGEDGKRRVKIPRQIEIFENGEWLPYPVACWIDQSDNPDGIFSRVMALQGEDLYIWQSSRGVPDGALLVAAEEAGIFTETFKM